MKRSSHAIDPKAGPNAPAGDLAQPDERDLTTESGRPPDRQTLGPRRIIDQAGRDLARGLQDTDRHGTPNDLPRPDGPPDQTAEPLTGGSGNRRSYARDQGGKAH